MTVSTEVNHNEYTGNGVTTSFPYTFRVFKASDLVVTTSDTNGVLRTLMLNTDYTVTGVGSYSGGSVVLPLALAASWVISIERSLAVVQETDLRNQGKFFAETHESAFDYLTMLIQQCFGWSRLALLKPSFLARYYDAKQNRISNLADPGAAQDAVNNRSMRSYVDAAIAGVVGGFGWFIQYGSGAVYRTFQDKMRESLTPEDFGAPANGVDDDSPAVQLALNEAIESGKSLRLDGNYCFFTTVEAITSKKVVITGSGIIHHKGGAFKLSGVVGPEIDTTVSITDFNATSISLVDASGFNLNDLGIIHSATMCLSEDAGSMQLGIATAGGAPSWFGEFFRINGKAGNTINLTTPLVFNSYRTTPQPNSGARTKTTVKKVTPVRGSISGNLTFLREGNANTAVEITYGDGFTVKGRFYNGKIAGAAVVFKYSYMCEVGPDSYFNIDADTPINFGSVVWPEGQVSAGDYYNFNSVKCVSSQMCGCSGAQFENTSQTFDITYDTMPSIGCYFKGNKVMFARFNMATSHGGSFGNMFDSNLGVACWRGIASRSREDCITNNRILGFRRFPTNPNTSGDTYGIGLTEGFTIGNTVIGNYISGFFRDVYINAGSSRGPGLDYMRITVEGNRMSYCRHHVDVDLSTPSVKGTESGISIAHNQFDSNTRQSLNFGQYLTAVIIRDNVWVDAPSEDFYVINAEGNCKDFDISGNSFKKSTAGGEKYVWMKSITDPDLGPDTVQNANVTFRANVVRGTVDPDGFVYGTVSPTQVRLPPGSGFESMQTGGALRLTGITGDYTLDPLTANNVAFSPSVAFNVLGITGGNNGRDLVLWNNSGTNAITVKNSATVQTRSNADFVLTANTPLHLRYMNSKWREV